MMGSTRERKGLNDITNVIERKTTAQMVKVNRSRNQQLIDSHTQQLHANDIVSNLRRSETKHMSSADCFRHQQYITPKMRSVLVDWLVDVHLKAKLHTETLFLAVNILDRYLCKAEVTREDLQLSGICALLIAAKYEEIYPPEIEYLENITGIAYTKDVIIEYELRMLCVLKFSITIASVNYFLLHYLDAEKSNNSTNLLATYYAQRSLQEFSLVSHPPSLLAAACVFLARAGTQYSTHDDQPWTRTLKKCTGYTYETVYHCAQDLRGLYQAESTLSAVRNKFNRRKFGKVSIMPLPQL